MAAKAANKNVQEESPTLKAAEAAIRKKFGEGAVIYMSQYAKKAPGVVKSGSIGLDYALGVGGFTRGKMVEFFGTPGSGKTTLAWSIAASALQQFPDKKVLYIDAEKSSAVSLIDAMGVDRSKVVMVNAETAEQNLDIGETLIKTGAFSVAIVDSVAALVPRAEYEATMEDQQIGLHARLMSKMCRNYKPVINTTDTLLVLINQIRQKITTYGDPDTTTGGNAIPFYCDIRVKVSTSHTKKNLIRDPTTGDVIGQPVTFYIVKNKLWPPFRQADVDLMFGKGFDTAGELVELGEQMGLVVRSGAWYEYEGTRVQGKAALVEKLSTEVELAASLSKDIYAVLGASRKSGGLGE